MIMEESNLLLGPFSKDLAVFIYIILLRLQSLHAALCIYIYGILIYLLISVHGTVAVCILLPVAIDGIDVLLLLLL